MPAAKTLTSTSTTVVKKRLKRSSTTKTSKSIEAVISNNALLNTDVENDKVAKQAAFKAAKAIKLGNDKRKKEKNVRLLSYVCIHLSSLSQFLGDSS